LISWLSSKLISSIILETVKCWSCCRRCWYGSWSGSLVESCVLGFKSSNVDISSKARNRFSFSIVGDDLWDSSITGSVSCQDGLSSSVSGSSSRSRTSIATISRFSQVALTCWVRLPCAIKRAEGINIRAVDTIKSASMIEETLCTISRDAGACSGNLFVHARIVLDASGNIRPGSILLTQWDIISAKITHNIATLSWK